MSLREFVFGAVAGNATLQALGFSASNIFAVQAPDTPPDEEFAVLRFSSSNNGLSGANRNRRYRQVECSLWVYDRQMDYDRVIGPALDAFEILAAGWSGNDMGDGERLFETEFVGQDDDGWDDIYNRIVRAARVTLTYAAPGGVSSD